jgi:thymidine kinase
MSLEVVVGPMFSGKSSYALSYVRRQQAIGRKVLVIKPDIDNRYSHENVLVTHNKEEIPCMLWKTSEPLCNIKDIDYDCFVIEEAQFFNHLPHFCSYLLYGHKKQILVVGLDACSKQKKFGEILDIIPMASSVTKLNALCGMCGDGTIAPFTKKLDLEWGGQQVDVGGNDKYAAVCLKHLTNAAQ